MVEYTSAPPNRVETVIKLLVRVLPVNVDTARLVVDRVDPTNVENTVKVFVATVLPVSVEKVIADAPSVLVIKVDWTDKELTRMLLPIKVDIVKITKLIVQAFNVETRMVSA